MSEPVVQLDDFGLTDLQIHWKSAAGKRDEVTSTFNVGYVVEHLTSDPTRFRLNLTVKDDRAAGGGNSIANLEATIVGFFSFPVETEPTEREKRIRINGLTMLYGTLRGVLANVCGVFPPDLRYVLPTVNMLDVIKSVEEKRARKARTKQPTTTGDVADGKARTRRRAATLS